MGGGGGVAGQGLGAAETYGELEDAQGVEDAKRLRLAAAEFHAEGGARAGTLGSVDSACGGVGGVAAEEIDFCDGWVVGQEGDDGLGAAGGVMHAEGQGFEGAAGHPAGMGGELGADGAAQQADRAKALAGSKDGAGYQVAVAADVFGQRVDDEVDP